MKNVTCCSPDIAGFLFFCRRRHILIEKSVKVRNIRFRFLEKKPVQSQWDKQERYWFLAYKPLIYNARMTINAVISANSKLPITIMVILYFRANGPLLLCAINNSNDKTQGDKYNIAIILKQEIDSKKNWKIFTTAIFFFYS